MSTSCPRLLISLSCVCCLLTLNGCGVDETDTVQSLKDLGVLVVPGGDGKASSLNNLPTDPAKLTEAVQLIAKLGAPKSITALDGTPMSDEHLAEIGKIKNLVELQINGGSITDQGVAHLTGLQKLESLTLARTDVTAACMPDLGRLSSLNMLNLNHSKVDGGYENLADLDNLQWLLLGGLTISDQDAEAISKFPAISHVTLDASTNISESAIDALKSNKNCNVDYAGGSGGNE